MRAYRPQGIAIFVHGNPFAATQYPFIATILGPHAEFDFVPSLRFQALFGSFDNPIPVIRV